MNRILTSIRNINLLFLMIVLMGMGATSLFAQVDTVWARFLNGGPGCYDEARYMIRDANGNFYLAGNSSADFLIARFSASGDSLWSTRLDGANTEDFTHGLAMDDSGYVYLCGYGDIPGHVLDFFVFRYHPDTGDTLWSVRIPGMWCQTNFKITPMITGGTRGSVYATASRKDSSAVPYATSFCTVKINHRGEITWTARYPDTSEGYYRPSAIARDDQENIYVVGTAPQNSIDFATVKYDSSGQQLWVAIYDGPLHNSDYPYAVLPDNNGHVYVTGRTFAGGASLYAFCTICYDAATGDTLWVRHYASPDSGNESYLLALDNNGNLVVVGTAYAGTIMADDIAVVKYDPNGNLLWDTRYEYFGDQTPVALTIDEQGGVYVTGHQSGKTDMLTLKFDASGNLEWTAQFRTNGWRETGNAIQVEGENIFYVAGRSQDDFCLLKYAPGARIGLAPTSFDFFPDQTGTASATITLNNTAPAGSKTLKWKLVDRQAPGARKTHFLPRNPPTRSTKVFTMPYPPGTEEVNGITFGNLGIWIADVNNQKIIKLDPVSGDVLRTFPVSTSFPGGLAHDGHYLWFYDFAGDLIQKMDPLTGQVLHTLPNPLAGGEGLTCDGTYLYRGGADSLIVRFDTTGTVLDTIPLLAPWCQGMAWDGQYLWYAISYRLWQLSGDSVLQSFITPGHSEAGITFDGEFIRFADNVGKEIVSAEAGIITVDCPWLTLSDTSGTLAPGQSTNITVEVNAAGLDSGRYQAHLLLTSTDPERHTLLIPVQLNVDIPNAIATDSLPVPLQFRLEQNYPNPFNPITTIAFRIPGTPGSAGNLDLVTLQIFDILGRKVETLVHQKLPPGEYRIQWDTSRRSIPSGIYYYRLKYQNREMVKKMVLIK